MNENKNLYGQNSSDMSTLGCDVRNYVSGDSMKMIHWKNSAKTHELVTRQYESVIEECTAVLVDTHLASLSYSERIAAADTILETMLALADYFCANNSGMHLYLESRNGIDVIPVALESDYRRLYDKCPDIDMRVKGHAANALNLMSCKTGSGSNIIVICYRADEAMYKSVRLSIERGCQITLINVTEPSDDMTYSIFDSISSPLFHIIYISEDDDICEVLSE